MTDPTWQLPPGEKPQPPQAPYQPPYPQQQYAPPQQYGQPYPQPQPILVQQNPTSGYATASMVCGILGLITGCCSFGIPSIIAVVLGHMALKETRNGVKGGHGQAIAGLILGYILAVPAAVFSIMVIFGGVLSAVDPSSTPTP